MPIPLKGDRSARDMDYAELHATDIEDAEYEYHVPPASLQTVGDILRATANGWEAGAEISSLTVEEVDEDPSVDEVNKIIFPNGSLTDEGSGVVSVAFDVTRYELLVDDDMNILFDDNGDLLYEG